MLDPRNGEVLTLRSLPAYDPNDFAAGIDRATWASLNTDKLRPLQNRAIQGRYSPGSTFKIVVATAALEEGLITPDFTVNCPGGGTFFGRYFKCHLEGRPRLRGHAPRDREVLQRLLLHARQHARRGQDLQVGGEARPGAARPASTCRTSRRASCRRPNGSRSATTNAGIPGETISVSIGQGQVSVTPVSLAVMIATVANGGTRVTPHLVRAVDEGGGLGAGRRRRRRRRAVP